MRLSLRKPPPPPLPMSRFDHLVAGLDLLRLSEQQIENTIIDLHNALACFEAAGSRIPATVHRTEQLLMRLREVQAATR